MYNINYHKYFTCISFVQQSICYVSALVYVYGLLFKSELKYKRVMKINFTLRNTNHIKHSVLIYYMKGCSDRSLKGCIWE